MRKILTAVLAAITCCMVALFAACESGGGNKPQKLKDGIALTLTEGDSRDINLAEYISVEGTDYVYEVNSSSPSVASVTLSGSTATVTALSGGAAKVTASAGGVSAEFAVTVNAKGETPAEKDPPVFGDITLEYDLKDEESKTVTLAPEAGDGAYVYEYKLKQADAAVLIHENKLTAEYTEVTAKTLVVIASYTDSENPSAPAKEVEFNVIVNVTDTRDHSDATLDYKVRNGSFDNGLTGWIMEGDMGAISEDGTFWADEASGFAGYPIYNVGKYFAGNEPATGTLESSSFKVGGINKITFMLGAAGNTKCYITLEKTDGTVLEIWRNTKFHDIQSGWDVDEIGKTQFANNLVTYVADLSKYEGETVRIVLHDEAVSGFGFINFDELVTYYASEEDLPAGATATVNELADKTALETALESEITAQGDYTAESFEAYRAKVQSAKDALGYVAALQSEVDKALGDLQTAENALTLRVPHEVQDAEKIFSMLSGSHKTIDLSDYVNEENLSKITYEITSGNTLVTAGEPDGKNVLLTAGTTEADTVVTLTICVKYDGEEKLSVRLTVTVTAEAKPVLKESAYAKHADIYSLENKSQIILDFTANISNPENVALTYEVTGNDGKVTLNADNCLAYSLDGSYSETAVEITYNVKVSYGQNGSYIEYVYTLSVADTTSYRIVNGGFDNGLEGWILSNPDLGGVNSAQTYWPENIPFNNDGNFFNAYYFDGEAKEGATGTLKSSPFTVGGSGWITYKLGGAKNADKVFLDVIEKDTGIILARYYNNAFSDDGASTEVRGCTLVSYRADLSAYTGKTVYIRISDNAVRDYGLFFADSFVTYYPEAPATGNEAVAVAGKPENIYQILNGGFETGDLTGWELTSGEVPGKVSNLTGYWGDNHPYNKDGGWLFTGAEGQSFETDPNLEYRVGTLRSNVFTLKAGGWISFKLGGAISVEVTNIKVVTADGTVLAIFHNTNPASPEGGLVQYVYRFADLEEDTECYIEIYDNATTNWGLIAADSFITDYDSEPQLDGAVTATNKK